MRRLASIASLALALGGCETRGNVLAGLDGGLSPDVELPDVSFSDGEPELEGGLPPDASFPFFDAPFDALEGDATFSDDATFPDDAAVETGLGFDAHD